jgi:hypothetical protein
MGKQTNSPSVTQHTTTLETKSNKEIELENKLLKMEEMLRQLTEKHIQLQPEVKVETTVESKKPNPDEDDMDDMPPNKWIKVMSLTNNKLSLSTESRGKGKVYNFTEFGQIQNIIYQDLSNIIHNHPEFTRNGVYIIMNPKVVRLHGLEAYYEKILNKDKITGIIDLDKNEIVDRFNSSTVKNQEAIVSILTERLLSGENLDLNKVELISNLCGRDINATIKEIKSRNAEQ